MSKLWNKAAIAAVLMFLGGAQASIAFGAADIPPAQTAQARTLCSDIIGVYPGNGRFNGCVASLAASLQSARREHAIIRARSACFARGLQPGSPALSLCLLDASAANPKSAAADPLIGVNAPEDTGDPPGAVNLVPTARADMTDREKQACAQTGFDPAFGAFANCVADLQSVLQDTDIPAN